MEQTKTTLARINLQSTLLSLEIRKGIAQKKNSDLAKDLQDLINNINQALAVHEDLVAEVNFLEKRCFKLEAENYKIIQELRVLTNAE